MPRPAAQPRSAWGKFVQSVLLEHGLTSRNQRDRTGVPHSTVAGWLRDTPPSLGNVVAFAQGFGLDQSEALRIAGLTPPGEPRGSVLAASPDVIQAFTHEMAARITANLDDMGFFRRGRAALWMINGLLDLQERYPGVCIPIPKVEGGYEDCHTETIIKLLEEIEERIKAGEYPRMNAEEG